MPDEPRTVDIHEMVYGSAARLLDPGASDLGVIASTRDFPSDVARRLASHRGGFKTDHGATGAVRYIVGMIGSRLEFTRVQMGTDHTGRTIPFVRHLVLPLDGGNRWGDLVKRCAAHAQDPRQATAGWITPAPRLEPSPPAKPPGEALAKAIASAAETVMRYQETKRPVLLVHATPASPEPAADPFLGIVAAIGDVLPNSCLSSLVAATHAVDTDDRLAEASVLATYPGTPFHKEMTGRSGSRRPLFIDVARAVVEGAATPPSAFVRATVADIMAGRPGRYAKLCDRLRAKPEHWPLVADVATAQNAVEVKPSLASVKAFVDAVRKAGGAATGAGLDRGLLQQMAVETISGALDGLTKDAAAQTDGTGRLGSLLVIDEALQMQATRAGIAMLTAGSRAGAEVLANALADIGEDAIAVARRIAGDLPAGRAFVELVEPPAVVKAQGKDPETIEVAVRKQKPQRRNATAGPRATTGANPRAGHGGPAAVGSPLWGRLVTLVVFAPALVGVGLPVWRAYVPPPEARDTKLADSDAGQKSSVADPKPDGAQQTPRRGWLDVAHRKAIGEAIKRAKPLHSIPGILCVVALGLLLLNGVLTRVAFAALQPVGGGLVATFLPTLVLLAVSATGGYLGYSAGVSEKGQEQPAESEATPPKDNEQAARGDSRQEQESSDKTEKTTGVENQPRAEPAAEQQQ